MPRLLDGLAQRDGSAELAVEVDGRPLPLAGLDAQGFVLELGGEGQRGIAPLRPRERRQRDDRLEDAPGLALGLRRAVELAAPVVASADQREHLAAARVQGDERPLERALLALQVREAALQLRQPLA
jgi:hypothetical protein